MFRSLGGGRFGVVIKPKRTPSEAEWEWGGMEQNQMEQNQVPLHIHNAMPCAWRLGRTELGIPCRGWSIVGTQHMHRV